MITLLVLLSLGFALLLLGLLSELLLAICRELPLLSKIPSSFFVEMLSVSQGGEGRTFMAMPNSRNLSSSSKNSQIVFSTFSNSSSLRTMPFFFILFLSVSSSRLLSSFSHGCSSFPSAFSFCSFLCFFSCSSCLFSSASTKSLERFVLVRKPPIDSLLLLLCLLTWEWTGEGTKFPWQEVACLFLGIHGLVSVKSFSFQFTISCKFQRPNLQRVAYQYSF